MELAKGYPIDLPVLLETRLLVQANSGGGKSWLLRRLLEQTAPHVQQLVIDPEGEFSTLREKFDYVIAAPHDGDALAAPKTAALLARRLLETGVSAILDIYDLKAHERQAFVRLFLDALVNAPRNLWHPCMVVVDEAHVFCPQHGSAEASQSVIDVATRGRKRGQCLVLATQRLSKLHKDTAAEMLNKLIGRTALDVDVKRAADELGMNAKDAMMELRSLLPGQFYAFGPALSSNVSKITVGGTATSHPKPGDRLMKAPPAPSTKIKAQLAKLSDLQKEAEAEARTIDELRAEIVRLKRDAKKPVVDETEIQRRVTKAVEADRRAVKKAWAEMEDQVRVAFVSAKNITDKLATSPAFPEIELKPRNSLLGVCADRYVLDEVEQLNKSKNGKTLIPVTFVAAPNDVQVTPTTLRSGAMKILRELAARSPAGYSRAQVGALTKFSHKGGTFNTYLSDLRRAGFIEERDGLLFASDAGVAQFGDKPPAPATHDEIMAQWARALRSGAYKMLEGIVSAGSDGIHRANLADMVNMTASGGTFNTYLSDLRRNGLISEHGKRLVGNDILFP